jgi:parvulin-like peptidyl-prolyl isomerase
LTEELKKEGVSQDQFHERIRKQLMMQRIIRDDVRPKVKQPDEADTKAAWDKLQFIVKGDTSAVAGMPEQEGQAYLAFGQRIKDFASERVRAAHILIKVGPKASDAEQAQALDRAKDLRKRALTGEDFGDLARKYSDDGESAPRGGDLGFIVHGYLPPDLEKAVFSTGVGEVSEPVKTDFGYHVVRVIEKKASESVSFDKVKDDVAQFLSQLRSNMELEKYVKNLRSKATIETNIPKDTGAKETAKDTAPATAPTPPTKNN